MSKRFLFDVALKNTRCRRKNDLYKRRKWKSFIRNDIKRNISLGNEVIAVMRN